MRHKLAVTFIRALLTGGCVVWASAALAITIAEAGPPAELPPAGFAGMQFADSRGCVYVRTGGASDQGGWAPRVSRDGQVICGLVPTFETRSAGIANAVPPSEIGFEGGVAARPAIYLIPPGYKPAWDDGRLNPLRGPRVGVNP